MKIWTYEEMKNKILLDLDLQDETFITPDEMVGYFNEALNEAESEIITLNQDYFLTKFYVPLVAGTAQYAMPYNCYANKIRGVMYSNGSIIYPVVRYRRQNEFEDLAFTDQYGVADDYRYLLVNNYVGKSIFELHPTSRDTAILPPSASAFTPMILWYIRNCARVPIVGEYCNPEIIAPTQVSIAADTIQTYAGTTTIGIPQQGAVGGYPGSIAYITGDAVQLQPAPSGTIPAPLVAGTTYYIIALGSGSVKLATTRANAILGTAINLTTQGTVYHTMTVAATEAIIDAELIDIPEFATFVMQWVKCRCMEKEGDPRLDGAAGVLIQQKKQMVDTLVQMVPDDDDTIQADFSAYQEMS